MTSVENTGNPETMCNFRYLHEIVNGNLNLIGGIMDAFLKQVPEDLTTINEAIILEDYSTIRSYAHTMKSSASIMGISALAPILDELVMLSEKAVDIDKITSLNFQLNSILKQAIEEVKTEKLNNIQT
ncbi:MAG: Hpt domain-containing protein [Bacteroidetes bacterium]|nr:Hpt domain-containing protein [Bacteroidota bacterium]MBU1719350.1 Hpt domain-containing protein [Bacteroidota bacterium]